MKLFSLTSLVMAMGISPFVSAASASTTPPSLANSPLANNSETASNVTSTSPATGTSASVSQQEEAFFEFVNQYLDQYETWRDDYLQEIDQQKQALIAKWGEGELSDAQQEVNYSSDQQVRTVVDYQNNTASVSVLIDADASEQEAFDLAAQQGLHYDGQSLSLDEGQQSVKAVTYSIESERKERAVIVRQAELQMNELDKQGDRLLNTPTGLPDNLILKRVHLKKLAVLDETKQRVATLHQYYQKMRKLHGISEPLEKAPAERLQTTPTLKPATDNPGDSKLHTASVEHHGVESGGHAQNPNLGSQSNENSAQPGIAKAEKVTTAKKVVTIEVKLPANSLRKRAEKYAPLAQSEAQQWQLPAALIMAIMHSESSFRPTAKSYVPAYGLMQIVPTTAGHDVNKLVRQLDKPMKADELYNPETNVETGSAYLNILNKRYLKSIRDPQSRLYCTIAAYNTGAGNVAKTFNADRSTSIGRAAKVINQLTPDEVYQTLMAKLPYDETKNYLDKVYHRIALYQ